MTLANAAFVIVKRLTPFRAHHLAQSLLLPVLFYRADLFTLNGAMVKKMDVFWHMVQHWVTNWFSSTLVNVLAVEAALPTIGLLLTHKKRMAAATLVCTPSPICMAAVWLPSDFSSPFSFREPRSLRSRKWKKPLTGPLPGKTTTKTRIRTRLPLNDLAHLVLPFVLLTGNFPPRLAHLVPSDFPAPHTPSSTWPTLAAKVKMVLKDKWAKMPLPAYNPFTPPPGPPPFMGLPKFIAGRIHQMRAGKSYLAAHPPSWCKDPVLPTCPRCSSVDETFTHAVFGCPPHEWARLRPLWAVLSLDPAYPVRISPPLVVAFAKFIKATATGFPDRMSPLGTDSPYVTPPASPRLSAPTLPYPPQHTWALVDAFALAWGATG